MEEVSLLLHSFLSALFDGNSKVQSYARQQLEEFLDVKKSNIPMLLALWLSKLWAKKAILLKI